MSIPDQIEAALQAVLPALDAYLPPQTPAADVTWIVGVSGGPDSLALLHALTKMTPAPRLLVAHLDHQLRPQAAVDAEFVRQTAVSLHLRFAGDRVDVTTLAATERLSLEAAGRLARYRFFAQLARIEQPALVLVAHHADDQAETVLMHLLRGSGLNGLRGMQVLSPLPTDSRFALLRPLLHTTRAEIEAYCQHHHLSPVIDETNTDPAYRRNRLRHELLPMLSTYNPQIVKSLGQLAAIVAADYDWLQQQAASVYATLLRRSGEGWLHLDREAWQQQPLSLQRLILRHAIAQLRPDLSDVGFGPVTEALTLLAVGEGSQQLLLPGDLVFQVQYDMAALSLPGRQIPPDVPQMEGAEERPLPVPGQLQLGGNWLLTAEWMPDVDMEQVKAHDDPWTVFIPTGLADELRVRVRFPGEQWQPLGMNGRSATLQDVMVNRKIPRETRGQWPLVVTARHPVWLVGHQLDHRARLQPHHAGAIRLRCRKIS